MSPGKIAFWIATILGVPASLYGLHRLALWLEERGHLYYLNKKPTGGGGAVGGFVAFQRIIEPQAQHVVEIRDHVAQDDDEASGRGRLTGRGEQGSDEPTTDDPGTST